MPRRRGSCSFCFLTTLLQRDTKVLLNGHNINTNRYLQCSPPYLAQYAAWIRARCTCALLALSPKTTYIQINNMSTKYKFRAQNQLYFVTFAVVYWIDLFIRNEYKNVLLESWKHCQQHKGL